MALRLEPSGIHVIISSQDGFARILSTATRSVRSGVSPVFPDLVNQLF